MESLKELKEKYGGSEPTWRIKLVRKVSIRLTWLLLHTPITGNQVTFFMFVFGLFSAICFMFGNYYLNLLGILYFHISIILDGSDGQVARYRKEVSSKGVYYDLMHHIIVNPLIILGIGIGAYFNNSLPIPNKIFLYFGIIGAYFLIMNSVIVLKKYESSIKTSNFKEIRKVYKNLCNDRKSNEIRDFFQIKIFNAIFFFGILNLLPFLVLIYGIAIPLMTIRSLKY